MWPGKPYPFNLYIAREDLLSRACIELEQCTGYRSAMP